MREFEIIQGDVLEALASMASESVQCVVTSPPYWGLRDYGTGSWTGGQEDCKHVVGGQVQDNKAEGAITAGVRPGVDASCCRKCGAVRVDQQLGLERTPEEYTEKMVEVFREVRRVLRDDGVMFLNLGDSYATTPPGCKGVSGSSGLNGAKGETTYRKTLEKSVGTKRSTIAPGLKPKDLVGIPWRVAFALQADGWWLRSAIPWLKKNGTPESVKDRPTTTVETVFMLTKSETYFYDSEAVKMPVAPDSVARTTRGRGPDHKWVNGPGDQTIANDMANACDPGGRLRRASDWFFESWQGLLTDSEDEPLAFVVNTNGFKEAHFATFPVKLVEPMIAAGTSERGCCPECGAPWVRVVERTEEVQESSKGSSFDRGKTGDRDGGDRTQPGERYRTVAKGWRPTCDHGHDPVPCKVADPFGGAMTTGLVALRLGRDAVLIELNSEYVDMGRERIIQDAPLFNVEAT